MKIFKIDSLLARFGYNRTNLAEHMNMSKSSMSNKVKRDSWTADDFIKLAELTGTTLAFIDREGKPLITFDIEDIKKDAQ